MGAIEGHNIYGLTIRESATDGSDFTNPGADYRRLFLGEDGLLYTRDAAGTVSPAGAAGGSVATDAIWDAAGDIVQGTGSNTSARLALGAAGTVVRSTGSTNAYAFPPGHEFDYTELTTTDTSITATVEASANTVITAGAVTGDGSTVMLIDVFFPSIRNTNTADTNFIALLLFDGSTSLGYLTTTFATASHDLRVPFRAARRLTPSAASHTYSVRGIVQSGTGHVYCGAGGTGNTVPGFIRITKA